MEETEALAVKLSELLRHPEDLDRISSLRSDFSRKKAHVDTVLKASLQSQLELTEAGINAINRGQTTLNIIKAEMMTIGKLCFEAENMIQEFPLINRISHIHKNFVEAEKIKSDLARLDQQLTDVDHMLAEDRLDDLSAPMPNFLEIHHTLHSLQDFRDEVMGQNAVKEDGDVMETLERYFAPLESRVEAFDERVGIIAMSLIQLVREGNLSLVVRLAKIIEAEERDDERVLALREAHDAHRELVTKFKSISKGHLTVRGYKDRFLECIKAAAQDKFDNAKEEFEGDPEVLADALSWYFEDLSTVKLEFPQLFPPKWDIWNTFLNIYHTLMHDFLKEQIDREDLDGASLLNIILWNGVYTKGIKALGIPLAELKPHVIDNKEAELLREYSQLISGKMEEWINSIIREDTSEFVSRVHQPLEEDGKWHMPNVPNMFQMINQQLNIALDSNKGNVVASVVEECVRLLKHRQAKWYEVVAQEIGKHTRALTREQQEELPDGILEYMMAVANDQLRCASYTEAVADRIAPLLSKKYADQSRSALEEVMNGFVDLATYTLGQIIEIIFHDISPPIKALFTSTWYNGTEMETMSHTMRSYVVDLEPGLDEDLFPAFMQQLSERTCIAYLNGVHNKGAKLKFDAEQQITTDVKTAFGFLSEYLNKQDVKDTWIVLEHFIDLVRTDKYQLGQVYAEFKEKYWDLPLSWVEQVCKIREDKTRDLLDGVKQRAAMGPRGGEPTIMSRLM